MHKGSRRSSKPGSVRLFSVLLTNTARLLSPLLLHAAPRRIAIGDVTNRPHKHHLWRDQYTPGVAGSNPISLGGTIRQISGIYPVLVYICLVYHIAKRRGLLVGQGVPPNMYTCLSALLAHTLLLLAVVTRFASGWKNCSISLEDHWIPAESRSLPEHMLTEYDRRYTCKFRPGTQGR